MKMIGTLEVDDPKILEMDPVQKMWMFQNWAMDQNDQVELAKNHAYLLASFSHPEAVKNIIGEDNKHYSTDEEFEESSQMVKEINMINDSKKEDKNNSVKRKRRRPIKG